MRSDLTPGVQLAQAVHAAVEYTLEHRDHVSRTPTVVVLEVGDEDQLLDYADRCPDGVLFYEPDISEHTALSVISDGSGFSNLRLAGAAMT